MLKILRNSKRRTIFWTLCLFITLVTFSVLVTNIHSAKAILDPNHVLSSSDIPDSILLSKLTSIADLDTNGSLTVGELASYTNSLDLSNINLTSIQGLGYASGATVIDLSGNNNLITIPDGVFLDAKYLTKIILPESIVSIGNSAFEGATALSDINLPAGLTTIGGKSFFGTSALISITLPTGIQSIGDSAFSTSGLTAIVIPNPEVKLGISIFNGCSSLSNVSLPEGITVIPMETFKATVAMTNFSFPTTLYIIEESAFAGSNLTIIDLSKSTNLTSIKTSAFSLTPVVSVTLPESLTELGARAFESCALLPQINIPSQITIINELTFRYNTNLVDVTFTPAAPNDYKLQEIGASAFFSASKLGNGNVQFLANLNNLTTIGDLAFAYSADAVKNPITNAVLKDEYNQPVYTGIQSVTLPNNLINIGVSAFTDNYALTKINIPDKVTEIKPSTFKNAYNLTDITLSTTLATIGANSFENNKSLTNITFPQSLTTIGSNAFLNAANEKYKIVDLKRQYVYTGLNSIVIPDSVTDIGIGAFKGDYNLSSVKLPSNLKVLNDSVFQNAAIQNKSDTGALVAGSYRGLQTINIPNTLTSIGNSTFANNYNLFGDGSVLVIPNSLVSIGNLTFSNDSNISLIDFAMAGSLTTIGSSAFSGTSKANLDKFNMAGNLTSIGASAFANSGILGILRIPDKVKIIQSSVFSGNSGITSVEFPDGLTSIGSSSFKNNTSLTSITIPAAATFVSMGTGSSFYGCLNFSNAIVKPLPSDISVYENASAVLPIKVFTINNSVLMGDESIAYAGPDLTQVTINGVKSGQTTALVKGLIQNQVGVDPKSFAPTVIKFETEVQFNIIVSAIKATSVSLPQSLRGVKMGSTLTLAPTILPSNTTDLKIWSSDNPLVATVSTTGIVTPVAYGTTLIRLKVGDLPEVQTQVSVVAPASGLTLDKTAQTLAIGQTTKITPTATYNIIYDSYKDNYPEVILWSTSDPNIAAVDQAGVVTAVGYGIATITARADAAGILKTSKITVVLDAPAGLSTSVVGKNHINLTWTAVTGATKYNIYRAATEIGTYSLVGTSTTNAYSSAGLSPNTTYWYKVSAVNSAGEGIKSAVVSGKTFATSPIAVPGSLSASAVSQTQINLKWTALTSAVKYNIYRATSLAGTYSYVGNSTTNAYSDTGLSANTPYWYKVSAIDNIGEGLPSAAVNCKTPNLMVSAPVDNLVTILGTVTVSGSVVPGSTVKVNGIVFATDVDGKFSKELTLSAGANTITITATDAAANVETVVKKVTNVYNATGIWNFKSNGSTLTPVLGWYSVPNGFSWLNSKEVSGDFNGDGKDDVAIVYNYGSNTTGIWKFTANTTGTAYSASLGWKSTLGAFSWANSKAVAGDVNGDGKDDIIILYDDGYNTSTLYTFISNGVSFTQNTAWKSNTGAFSWTKSKLAAGDFNGDGKDDAVILYNYGSSTSGLFTFISNGSTLAPKLTWKSAAGQFSWERSKITKADINGDLKDDIALLYDYALNTTEVWSFFSNGVSYAPILSWRSGIGGYSWAKSKLIAADVNGDGKDDPTVLYNYGGNTSGLWAFISNGSTVVPKMIWKSAAGQLSWDKSLLMSGDSNGDKKDDVQVFYSFK